MCIRDRYINILVSRLILIGLLIEFGSSLNSNRPLGMCMAPFTIPKLLTSDSSLTSIITVLEFSIKFFDSEKLSNLISLFASANNIFYVLVCMNFSL